MDDLGPISIVSLLFTTLDSKMELETLKGEIYMKTIRWGIIGAGRISSTFATALTAMENTKLAAIASRDLTKAKDFAGRFQIDMAYGSYEELALDPDIDVIYIGTPHTEHMVNTVLCLKNKKAVLCEKPFTVNTREAEYLIQLAKDNEVFLMEAMWTKFQPITNRVKTWVADGRIGRINYMDIAFGYQSAFNIDSRSYNPYLAGGALLDVGIYPVTYAIHILDRLPDQVVSNAVLGSSNVDEVNSIIFKYKEGILANLSSAVAANLGHDALIVGDKGRIFVPEFWQAQKAELYDREGNLIETASIPFMINGYEYEAMEVNNCLREGRIESRINPLKDTLDILKVMDDIRKDWGLVYPTELI